MNFDEIHPAMREAIATFEMLRRYGFSSDEIHWYHNGNEPPGPEPRGMMFVVLMTQGKRFNVRTGVVASTFDEWQEAWLKVANALVAGEISQADRDRILEESDVFRRRIELGEALAAKGIQPPVLLARLN